MMTKKLTCLLTTVLFWTFLPAQTPILGDWITVDDETGQQFSVVSIYQAADGLYYGDIKEILYKIDDPELLLCTLCKGEDYRKPMEGLTIIRGMHLKNGELQGGRVLDPNNGKFYYGKIYLNREGKLVLRGSIDKAGILGRSQTWLPKSN